MQLGLDTQRLDTLHKSDIRAHKAPEKASPTLKNLPGEF